jgi:hypothetical protein
MSDKLAVFQSGKAMLATGFNAGTKIFSTMDNSAGALDNHAKRMNLDSKADLIETAVKVSLRMQEIKEKHGPDVLAGAMQLIDEL